MKGEAAIGDVQDQAAIFGAHADVGDLHEFSPGRLAAVGRCVVLRHWRRQLDFRLGKRKKFYFLAALRLDLLQGQVQSELPRTLSFGNPGTSKAKIEGLPEKYIGPTQRRGALRPPAANPGMVPAPDRDVQCRLDQTCRQAWRAT